MAIYECPDCGGDRWDGNGWHGSYTTPHCDCEMEWLMYIAELLKDEDDDTEATPAVQESKPCQTDQPITDCAGYFWICINCQNCPLYS